MVSSLIHWTLTYSGVGHDDHHVGVWSKDVDEGCEARVVYFHALEGGRQLTAAQLELFDDVTDLLKPMHVTVGLPLTVRYHLCKTHKL